LAKNVEADATEWGKVAKGRIEAQAKGKGRETKKGRPRDPRPKA
jgi:hypothetical protein